MTEHLVAPQPTLTRGVAVRIWVALLVANILVYAALATPGILTLSMRFTEIESLNPVAMLSIVIGVSSVAQLVIGPLVGRLSDRTGARIGMRRPWLIGCGIVGLLGTTTIAVVVDPTAIVIAWAVASAAYVAANVVLVSIMIDHVPVHLHGRISFAIAAASFIAPAAGAALVPLLGNSPTWGLLVPAIATVVLLPLLAFALPDRQLETRPPRFTLRELGQSYWINPLGRPSFAALLVTAFCAIGAYAIPQIYLYYVLAFTIKISESDLPGAVSLLAAIGAVAAIGAGALGGYLSDKLR
ncbi:MAG TPA: MFS transporter, partial [Pseudolysinimonas sp.]|nr:MFS transporter [Pseudolysinimonas sp.]